MRRLLVDLNVVLDVLLDRKLHARFASAVWAAVIALDSGEKIAEETFEQGRTDPRVIEAYRGRGRARPARTGG